jgi:hypothetical protein
VAEITFRPPTSGDIEAIAADLCAGERMTMRDLYGPVDLKEKVAEAIMVSEDAQIGVYEGRPVGVVGVVSISLLEGIGNLWMMGTEELFRHRGSLVRAGRRHVARLHETYPRLVGRIDARHAGTLKWLRLLGFTVGEPVADGPVQFCFFERIDHV